MIEKEILEQMYLKNGFSKVEIATQLGVSPNKIDWWMKKHAIQTRTISEAIYLRSNKNGDPFSVKTNLTPSQLNLYYLGVGLFWGEGNKVNQWSIRLGNTDPDIILTFVNFLKIVCGVKPEKIRYGLQVFNDIDSDNAISYWRQVLDCDLDSFMKVVNSPPQGRGIYRKKSEYGVLTIYVHNKKLRDWMLLQVNMLRRHSSGVEHNHGKIGVSGSNPDVGSRLIK